MSQPPFRLLFVCMGNICRSPAAECTMRSLIESRGLEDQITCDSAGTIGYHSGNAPDSRMRAAGARRNLIIDGAARKFTAADLGEFDLILALDRENLRDIRALAKPGQNIEHVSLLTKFSQKHADLDVPDPYYGGESGFDLVLDMVAESCDGLLKHCEDSLKS